MFTHLFTWNVTFSCFPQCLMSPGLIQLHLSVEFCVLLGRAMSQKSRDDRAKQEPSPHGAMGSLQDQSATQGINFSYPQYLGDLPAGSAIPWALSSFFRDHTDSLTWLLAGLNLSLTSIPVLHCGLNNPTPTPTPTPTHTPSTPETPSRCGPSPERVLLRYSDLPFLLYCPNGQGSLLLPPGRSRP